MPHLPRTPPAHSMTTNLTTLALTFTHLLAACFSKGFFSAKEEKSTEACLEWALGGSSSIEVFIIASKSNEPVRLWGFLASLVPSAKSSDETPRGGGAASASADGSSKGF